MDDFNHMMEYQSEMMSGVSPAIEGVETQQQQAQQQQLELEELCTPQEITDPSRNKNTFVDETQTHVDGQSVSDNADEGVTPAKDDVHKSAHVDDGGDKCAVDSAECENKESATAAGDEITKQDEIPETEKLPEAEGDSVVKDENDGDGKDDDNDDREDKENAAQEGESNERNATETNVKPKKDDELDLNQCRICMTSENLLDIFRIGEKTSFRICDLIMKVVPTVKINERDYLPHSICGNCVDRIEAAYELRVQCEETDKMLRSKLKRSKKTRRAPSEFVLLDCAESSSDSDDDQKSDDEFQLSEESEESSESDSDSSYDEKKKRLPSVRGRRRGPAPQTLKRTIPPTVTVTPQPSKKSRNNSVVYIKAANSDDDDSGVATKKRQSVKTPMQNRLQFRCDVCNRPFGTAESLATHRRSHPDEKCTICAMVFKQRSALHQHMQRHREEPDRICKKCHRVFVSKAECQRHVQMAHPDTAVCQKCKRYFPNKSQLDAHKCNPIATAINSDRKPIETTSKRKNDTDTTVSGRDLFKSVAPLTTTYWSDSFSD